MGRITHFVWTDIGAEDEDAFNDWYSNEHVPDRILRIPGFLRGRRFRAVSGGPRYIAYYEMADRKVFWSEPYVQMRGNPDSKSRFFVQRFRNALRSTATIASESDVGEGLFLAVAGVTRLGEENDHYSAPLSDSDLEGAANQYGVPRVRLSRTDWELVNGNFKRMDSLSRGSLRPPDKVPAWMLTVEGDTAEKVSACIGTLMPKFGDEARVDAEAVMERISEVSPPAR
jgi:hypothetical protein